MTLGASMKGNKRGFPLGVARCAVEEMRVMWAVSWRLRLSVRLISSAVSSSSRVHDRSAGRALYVPEHHELAAQPNHITAGALTQPQLKLSFIDPWHLNGLLVWRKVCCSLWLGKGDWGKRTHPRALLLYTNRHASERKTWACLIYNRAYVWFSSTLPYWKNK